MENLYQSTEEYYHIKNAIFALAVDVFTKNKKNFDMSETEAYMAFSHGETFVKNLLKDVITKIKRSTQIALAAKEDGFDNTKAFANKINFRGFSADPFQDLENSELINNVMKMAWFFVFAPSQYEIQKNALNKKNTTEVKHKKKNDFGTKKDFGKSWDFNDYIGNSNEDDEEEDFDNGEDEENDEAHKFVVITIQKEYIRGGHGYWDKDDWDSLVKDDHRLCYIYDAKEFNMLYSDSVPDHTPNWLYKILDKYESSTPNGWCNEDVESTFEISNDMYNALIKDPHCSYYEGYDDEDDDSNEKTNVNIGNNEHKFIVIAHTKEQMKNLEGLVYDDHVLAYVYDANESFLPDWTPDWLYDIFNSIDEYGWNEFQESIFDLSEIFYKKLINHPQCAEHRMCSKNEAFGDYTEEDENNYREQEFISNPGEWNLDWPLKYGGRKAPQGGAEHLNSVNTDDGFYDFIFDSLNNSISKINKKAMEDMDKIEWSAENAGVHKVGTTSSGVDYVAGWLAQDYGLAILIFLYWDGKNIRAFVPFRGNPIDTITKSMINGDFDNDEYFEKKFNITDDEWDDFDSLGEYNFVDCLEEFEARLTVVDNNGNPIEIKPKLPKCKNESMNKVINLIYKHYGYTRMELQWEISLQQHYLTVRDIYYNPIIFIYNDKPNLVYVGDYMNNAPINISKKGWEQILINELDVIKKRRDQIDKERENNGFNDALRRAGLYNIFH